MQCNSEQSSKVCTVKEKLKKSSSKACATRPQKSETIPWGGELPMPAAGGAYLAELAETVLGCVCTRVPTYGWVAI